MPGFRKRRYLHAEDGSNTENISIGVGRIAICFLVIAQVVQVEGS